MYSIVGWHALTLPQDPKALRTARWEMLASLLAIGLDPKRSIIFHQDHVGLQRCIDFRFQLFPTEPEPHRTRMDPQLLDSDWETQEDDDMEGNPLCPFVLTFGSRTVDLGQASCIKECK